MDVLIENSLFLKQCSLISIKKSYSARVYWHFRLGAFSIYVKVSAVQWCAIQPRLFDHKAHTGMQPLKVFQSHHCCLNTEPTKERKRRICQRRDCIKWIHKDVSLSGRFLFSFRNITHSGKYLTLKVTDGMSRRNNAIFSCLFLHGNGDQIKNFDPRSLTFAKPASTIIIFSQASFKIFCARPKNLSLGIFASLKSIRTFQ